MVNAYAGEAIEAAINEGLITVDRLAEFQLLAKELVPQLQKAAASPSPGGGKKVLREWLFGPFGMPVVAWTPEAYTMWALEVLTVVGPAAVMLGLGGELRNAVRTTAGIGVVRRSPALRAMWAAMSALVKEEVKHAC
jgi:hypothetical protein